MKSDFTSIFSQVKTRVKLEGEELEKYLEAEREKAKMEKLQEKIKAERYDILRLNLDFLFIQGKPQIKLCAVVKAHTLFFPLSLGLTFCVKKKLFCKRKSPTSKLADYLSVTENILSAITKLRISSRYGFISLQMLEYLPITRAKEGCNTEITFIKLSI